MKKLQETHRLVDCSIYCSNEQSELVTPNRHARFVEVMEWQICDFAERQNQKSGLESFEYESFIPVHHRRRHCLCQSEVIIKSRIEVGFCCTDMKINRRQSKVIIESYQSSVLLKQRALRYIRRETESLKLCYHV